MSRIKVKQLEAGQQLNADVRCSNGRLLLTAGTTLTAKHLEILRTWGVAEVDIVGDGGGAEANSVSFDNLPDEVKGRIAQQLAQQFVQCDQTHPVIKELILYRRGRLISEYLAQEGAGR